MLQPFRISVVLYGAAGFLCLMFPHAAPAILAIVVAAALLQFVPRLARLVKLAHAAEHLAHQERSLASQLAAANSRLAEQNGQHVRAEAAAAAAQAENTALARASWELGEKYSELSERYQASQRLVDEVSHDFRTPLSVIKGYSEILREGMAGPLTEEQLKFSQLIIDRTRDLAQMVDDLLDTTRVRAGTLHVDRVACDAADICRGLHTVIDGRAAANNIIWVEEIDPQLPRVFADPEKLGRTLVNLALHAIKISPEGSRIVLSAWREGTNEVRISVTDAGPGIAPENLLAMQEQLSGKNGARRSAKGFGVALSIAGEFARLNLGQINVASEVRNGSEFSFALPVNEPAAIIACLFSHLAREQTAGGAIAVLRVTLPDGGEPPAQLRALLASTCFPGDLILAAPGGSALILAGYSQKPESWHRRLLGVAAGISQTSPRQKLSPFEVALVGACPYPGGLATATALVTEELETHAPIPRETLPAKRMPGALVAAV